MRKLKKLRVLLVIVLVFALVVPQGVFASPAKLLGKSGAVRGLAEMGPRLKTGGYKTEGLKPDYRLGEVIFKPVGDTVGILKKYRLNLLRRDQRIGYILASAPVGTDIDKLVTDLEKDRSVQYAQPNYIYKLSARPNDPQYSRQWAMPKINAEPGWGVARSNSAVTIAILDSGVDVNHPDLKGRLVSGTNTVNPLKSTRDDAGHGTHVAGIIGAAVNNGLGVAGVAGIAGVKIMPVKVFDQWGGSDISISDGITWAADHGAKVMNMSFGSFYRSKVLNDAIDYAYGKGIVMVAAAGNWASEEISYPAAVAKVIAVSALNKSDKLADFSSYGPQIDVCAPGEEIYSTFWDPYKGST
ncbi:MAG: S8 family serine peptidase, partial [Eubacteriales bacterium]